MYGLKSTGLLTYALANLFLATAFIIPDEYRHHAKLFRFLLHFTTVRTSVLWCPTKFLWCTSMVQRSFFLVCSVNSKTPTGAELKPVCFTNRRFRDSARLSFILRTTYADHIFRLSRTLVFVVWPTMSCFADWSKRRHVTFTIIECWTVSAVDGSTVKHIEPSRDCNIEPLR